MIGKQMKGTPSIRAMVGTNSLTIRAIKRILSRKGVSLGMVAILIGGPDWPTSVLTGILGLSCPKMLVGSIPCFFLVIPSVLTGAFLLRLQDGGSWKAISGVTLAVTSAVQFGAMFLALNYIDKELTDHAEEIQKDIDENPDEQVKLLTEVSFTYLFPSPVIFV